ncbi:hypothetical protein NPIL_595251 [Nephila pilipes]|uniref:Uncharacterized protein n=1 Tax=Nephila pilipes TaxID=299642 RepID=A0A8X6N0Z4_NEPPI|nr:hypothetical protein NPIL_595251 [Nephila pilipes]
MCRNVQKRMRTRLKQTNSKFGEETSLSRKGRFTDRMIDLISIYCGNAIKQNKACLAGKRKTVRAVCFHFRSSDKEALQFFVVWYLIRDRLVPKGLLESCVGTIRHMNKLPMAIMDSIKLNIWQDLF